MGLTEAESGLAELIVKGGIYRDLGGTSSREVLSTLVGLLPPIPSVSGDLLLKAVLEREALMSTFVGHGIALPHPRNPIIGAESGQFVALAFLENKVDWNSLDGGRVDTLMLIVSASAKQHLQILSKINFFCRQDDFRELLQKRAGRDELLRFIRETEKNWS